MLDAILLVVECLLFGFYNRRRRVSISLLSNFSLVSFSPLQQLSAHQCPSTSDMPSCVSPLFNVVTILAQLLLMWGYTFYKPFKVDSQKLREDPDMYHEFAYESVVSKQTSYV